MLKGQTLKDYAKLVLKLGVNLQKGQGLEIACPIEQKETAIAFTEQAYEMGAKIVRIRWSAEDIDRLNYLYAEEDALTNVPQFFVDGKMDLVKNNFCYVAIDADNPSAFKNVPACRLSAVSTARSLALKKFSDCVMNNGIRWCVASVPSKEWAKTVFPDAENPEELLSLAIEKTMRLNTPDPLSAWKTHVNTLNKRAKFLNDNSFTAVKMKSANGTDLTVGLAEDNLWISAKEKAKDGVEFIANMPTEEIFTAPHKNRVDGIVKSCMPLSYNGQIIDGITLIFKKGKIVNYSAEKGFDVLKNLIETDDGTKRLGEIALIGKNSPIRQCGILFYNTLFDENASCHLAIGKGYPSTVKNGDSMKKQELNRHGVNDSIEHVDFMVGSDDMDITGIKKDGTIIPLFKNGEWVI